MADDQHMAITGVYPLIMVDAHAKLIKFGCEKLESGTEIPHREAESRSRDDRQDRMSEVPKHRS